MKKSIVIVVVEEISKSTRGNILDWKLRIRGLIQGHILSQTTPTSHW